IFNRQTQDDEAKDFIEKNVTIENGVAVFDLSDITPYVHLNAIKTGWGSPEGNVTLMTVTGQGNNNNSDSSFNGGQQGGEQGGEITTSPAGETSIAGLKFWEWDGVDANAKITGALDNNFKTGSISGGALLWGDGSVIINHYTDLTGYNTLKIYGSNDIQLRALFNRQTQDDEAKDFIEKTATIENGVAVFDLSDITPYVHLNAIKTGWGSPEGNVTLMTVIGEGNNNNSDSSFNSGQQGNENQGGNQANTINEATESNKIQAIYNTNGVPSNALKSGINFIQMTDGTIKKVLVK
ncbi:MAG: hypothetical protein K5874_10665, partial [Bacteroidaceae bacterium]|nr:hypothetical protein [Bacteroidaceae bacterium]